MTGPNEEPYEVSTSSDVFEIRDDCGKCVMTFPDKGSADGMATLLNQVYRKGYKDGYRAGKQNRQKS